MSNSLSPELRWLVRESVSVLGEVIRHDLGDRDYDRIEEVRAQMTRTRGASRDQVIRELRPILNRLSLLNGDKRRDFALAYTLMLELMNTCENAYRSHRIRQRRPQVPPRERPDLIIYVLTAHPTEARSPHNIQAFHRIQEVLIRILETGMPLSDHLPSFLARELRHWLEVAWRTPTIRKHKPTVRDEAELIYSTLLNDEAFGAFLAAGRELAPVYARTWVGGDKDGHPGVDEKVFLQSLQLSRTLIHDWIHRRLAEIAETACLIRSDRLSELCRQAAITTRKARKLLPGDAQRVLRARASIQELIGTYEREVGALHPALVDLRQFLRVFPAFVVPIEFRESSDMLLSSPKVEGLAIYRMLQSLQEIAGKSDPRWYVRGFIISMAGSIEHIQIAAQLVHRALGAIRVPVIPLFEQSAALDAAVPIVRAMLRAPDIRHAIERYWGNHLEIMLGYSDSAKEAGVLPSRLKIVRAMHGVDRLCRAHSVTPVFFQGSGGSVDRGGGTIEEQTSGWSPGALRNYKVTIQGEVVERSLATPEITRRQLERIVESAGRWRSANKGNRRPKQISAFGRSAIDAFSERVCRHYQDKIRSPEFLRLIEHATPYGALDALKMGSRPSRRSTSLSVGSLRAIPWVLCWTQTRVLFPTWWGVGSSWRESSPREREALRAAIHARADGDPVFTTFVRALGFTLTKVELPVWRLYLENSGLSHDEVERAWREFTREHDEALAFAHAMLGPKLLKWRPWLEESIWLRSPMIHPLNLLQILALKDRDFDLLRITFLGTASGMMSTG